MMFVGDASCIMLSTERNAWIFVLHDGVGGGGSMVDLTRMDRFMDLFSMVDRWDGRLGLFSMHANG